MKIVTSEVMRKIDQETIEKGFVSGSVLMERAGLAAVEEIFKFVERIHERFRKQFVVLCGKGNSGGDGYVIAKAMFDIGLKVKVLAVVPERDLQGDALYHAKLLPSGVSVEKLDGDVVFKHGQILIDCLLGTGLSNNLTEPYLSIVSKVNASGLPVISIDIASGLNGTTGEICGDAVLADLTVGIGLPKTGYFTVEGASCTGVLKCVDIGFPREVIDGYAAEGLLISYEEVSGLFLRRPHNSHKYRCGNVAIIGGSKNYMGAVKLASAAAARSGAGMVSCFYPGNGEQQRFDSIISVGEDSCAERNFSIDVAEGIIQKLSKVKTVVLGPGLVGTESAKKILAALLTTNCRLVLDAGALGLVAAFRELIAEYNGDIVLTPHSGELRRLGKQLDVLGSDFEMAEAIAKILKVHIVFKGQFSRVYAPNGTYSINSTGCSTLATAGSGDVLSGIIGAFAAEFSDFYQSICAAVYIHGLVGEISDQGIRGTVADDLIETLPEALKSFSPFA